MSKHGFVAGLATAAFFAASHLSAAEVMLRIDLLTRVYPSPGLPFRYEIVYDDTVSPTSSSFPYETLYRGFVSRFTLTDLTTGEFQTIIPSEELVPSLSNSFLRVVDDPRSFNYADYWKMEISFRGFLYTPWGYASDAGCLVSGNIAENMLLGLEDFYENWEAVRDSTPPPNYPSAYCGVDGHSYLAITNIEKLPAPSVTDQIADLTQAVVAINVDAGIANSLDAKLDAVIAALDDTKRGDTPSAVNMLYSFINSVEAQRGKKLTDGQANSLVSAASAIAAQLAQP